MTEQQQNINSNIASQTPADGTIFVFSRGNRCTDARILFYSIGEALNLALLESRIDQLAADFDAAIP